MFIEELFEKKLNLLRNPMDQLTYDNNVIFYENPSYLEMKALLNKISNNGSYRGIYINNNIYLVASFSTYHLDMLSILYKNGYITKDQISKFDFEKNAFIVGKSQFIKEFSDEADWTCKEYISNIEGYNNRNGIIVISYNNETYSIPQIQKLLGPKQVKENKLYEYKFRHEIICGGDLIHVYENPSYIQMKILLTKLKKNSCYRGIDIHGTIYLADAYYVYHQDFCMALYDEGLLPEKYTQARTVIPFSFIVGREDEPFSISADFNPDRPNDSRNGIKVYGYREDILKTPEIQKLLGPNKNAPIKKNGEKANGALLEIV